MIYYFIIINIDRQDSDDELLRDSSSDDDKPWSEDVKKKYRQLKRIRREAEENEEDEDEDDEDKVKNKDGGGRVGDKKQPRFFEVKEGVEFRGGKAYMKKRNKSVFFSLNILIDNYFFYCC